MVRGCGLGSRSVRLRGVWWKRAVTIDPQPWQFPGRPRVLIESADPGGAAELSAALRRAGCVVATCRGPDGGADPEIRCPLHGLGPCVAVEGADLVVTALDLDQESGRDVLRGLRTRYPSVPLVVVATAAQAGDLDELLAGCTRVSSEAETAELLAAVLAALPSSDGSPGSTSPNLAS